MKLLESAKDLDKFQGSIVIIDHTNIPVYMNTFPSIFFFFMISLEEKCFCECTSVYNSLFVQN